MKELLENRGIFIDGYVDSRADEIGECFGFKPEKPDILDSKKDIVIIATEDPHISIDKVLIGKGFAPKNVIYLADKTIFEEEDFVYRGCKVGRYTYGYQYLLKNYPIAESIGRFCSINKYARIWNNHPLEYITTSPILDHREFYTWYEYQEVEERCRKYGKYFDNAEYEDSPLRDNRPVVIENDVWIGAGVMIMPGVHIGDGAVLAAGAVVTKDVEPYAIMGGVPAKLIRYRFDEQTVARLMKIRWWEWPLEKIFKEIELFYQPEKFLSDLCR